MTNVAVRCAGGGDELVGVMVTESLRSNFNLNKAAKINSAVFLKNIFRATKGEAMDG